MENRPWTTCWIKKFKEEQKNCQKRFKRLERGYPPFEFDESLIDIVDMEEFIKIEEFRIPIFVGSQFGIYPRIEKMPEFFNGRKVIAILSKSLLSGHVSGLTIYQIEENEKQFNYKRVERYPND
jgi:hypothetical protein